MFKNCQIIAISADGREYHTVEPGCERGTPKFVMSSSGIRAFYEYGPSKWREPIEDEEGNISFVEFTGSKSTEYGDLFDTLLLTPELFNDRYKVRPKEYVNEKREVKEWSANAKFCRAWKEDYEAEGFTITNDGELFKVNQAIKRFLRDDEFKRFVEQSEKQVWIVGEWHDESGIIVPCKCLIDLCPRKDSDFHKSMGDVKTTKNAKPVPWEKWCHAAGYDVQAAWNYQMFVAATNREITTFRFLLSENTPPYEVGRRMMSASLEDPERDLGDIASGRRQIKKMMGVYCACLKTGKWPGYDDTDESINGWTIVAPNPYADIARQFAPTYSFGEKPEADPEVEPDPDLIP